MEFGRIGSTDCIVSRLGFGCGAASNYDYGLLDEAAWIDGVGAALDAGVNFFDVADIYGFGHAENLLSRGLGSKRREVIIATKGGLRWDDNGRVSRDASPKWIVRALEDSLRRLRLDEIPLYQLHWPDPQTPVEKTLDALTRCQKQGKIRFIGLSNFSLADMQRLRGKHRIDSLQVPYNLLCRDIEKGILSWCHITQTSVFAHTGLARGLLAGRRALGSAFEANDTRNRSPYFSDHGRVQKQSLLSTLQLMSERTGHSVPSISLRWILDEPRVSAVLVGIKNRQQLNENVAALDWSLTSSDRETLAILSNACPSELAGTPAHQGAER
jgi:aryl-alcohol dehydrogenase-like predicted oxidoreductase